MSRVEADRTVVVGLKGGLGNQMFQYAAGRALAAAHAAELVLDTRTGFARDRLFRRTFGLDPFPIQARAAAAGERLPFWIERAAARIGRPARAPVARRPWGTLVTEIDCPPSIAALDARDTRVFLRGHWQSERHFSGVRTAIAAELRPPVSQRAAFREMAPIIESPNAIAIGVRLFEELPGASKSGVGGLVPIEAYAAAARLLAARIADPEFFVFCSAASSRLDGLRLPGRVRFLTPDHGFESSIDGLWLLSRCRTFVIANSTFFWWAAWLAESERAAVSVVAFDRFPNPATIPDRWNRVAV